MIASFLNPMLRLIPEKRAKASELIHHAWLDGVVVQGEIDVIRRAEEEEARRRALAPSPSKPMSDAAIKHMKEEEADAADASSSAARAARPERPDTPFAKLGRIGGGESRL